jgi:putative Holliday junction resolvase
MSQVNKPKATRIIGIDYGMARFGVAVSDELKIIATPLMTLQAEKKAEKTIVKLLAELEKHRELYSYQIEEIVIGLPLKMSGKMGLQADEVKYFSELLKQHLLEQNKEHISVVTWDERLTTVQAERSMREGNLTRKRRAQSVDKVAAVIILQSYLDLKKPQLYIST